MKKYTNLALSLLVTTLLIQPVFASVNPGIDPNELKIASDLPEGRAAALGLPGCTECDLRRAAAVKRIGDDTRERVASATSNPAPTENSGQQ